MPRAEVATRACAVCGSPEARRYREYFHCGACGYWASELAHDVENVSGPDREYELVSYKRTRESNYAAILKLLEHRHGPESSLLELGCADGLFLMMAGDLNDYSAIGIEPNAKMVGGNLYQQDIRAGFFPDVLEGSGRTFDIIALNCVFEHIPDLGRMIDTFKRYLKPGGSVMINVPVSSGFMFKLSKLMFGLRWSYPFDRLWQKGFVSPHLHYFASDNLAKLFAHHGLKLVEEQPLEMFSLGGMYARLSLDPSMRKFQRLYLLGLFYAYYPLSRLSSDARAFVFAMPG